MSDRKPSLRDRLRAVRRRLLWIGSTAGVCWGLAGMLGLLTLGAWLDLLWELSPQARILTLGAAGAAAGALIAVLLGRTLRRGSDQAIARRLDRVTASGGGILTGVELERPLAAACCSHLPEVTSGLAAMAVDHAADLAARVPAAKAMPAKPLGRSLGTLGLELAVLGLVAVCVPGLARTQWNRFFHPYGDVPPYSTLEFLVEPGDVEVVYGEQLDVRVTVVGGAVDRVEMVLAGQRTRDEVLPMFPEPDGRWRAALARVTEPAEYYLRAYRARSPRYSIRVITVPRIESVRFAIEPPAYTRMAPYQGPLPKEGVAGLRGTRVQVWAQSNRPLAGGALTLATSAGTSRVPMKPTADGGSEVLGQFQVSSDGKFQLAVTDVDGQESRESFAGTITLLADERPFLRLLKPLPQSLATPTATIPAVLSAEDDYGISRVQLFRSLNGSRARPQDLPVPSPPARRTYHTQYLPLGEYGLRPGDEIKLFGRVEDNDPAGAKGAESTVATVRIISQEEFERMLRVRQGLQVLASKYREAQRRTEGLVKELEALRKKLEGLPPKSAAAKELREATKRMALRLRDESRAIRELAGRPLPYDLDKHLSPQLEELARQLEAGAALLEGLDKEPDLANQLLAEQVAKLLAKLGAGRVDFSKLAMVPIEHLAKIFPLLADASRFIALAARQDDLAERMASLRGRDGQDDPVLKARMRDLEDQQRQIREDLNVLLEDIGNHTAELPDEPEFDKLRQTAAKFVKAVRSSGALEAMSQAESALAEFSGTRAHAKAKEAAEILAKFIRICDAGDAEGIPGLGRLCLVFQPTLLRGLGQTVEQLLAEMGLPGGGGLGGFGLGAGQGGYSARRGGNVGLYGSLPGMDSGGQGEGQFGEGAGKGEGSGSGQTRGGSNPDARTGLDQPSDPRTAGGADAAVPLEYRRRVSQYFQRIAEEVGKAGTRD
jgi:hypothetical protein